MTVALSPNKKAQVITTIKYNVFIANSSNLMNISYENMHLSVYVTFQCKIRQFT